VQLARFRKLKVACFLSYVEYRSNTNTSNIIYAYKYIQNMYPKVGLEEETKGGGKEGKKVNNNETLHLCGNETQGNTLKTVKQHRMGGKGEEVQYRGVS
jgi:hypothetical protein